MTLSIQPIKAVLGAEVSGIDLSRPLADATQQELNALFTQHALLAGDVQFTTDNLTQLLPQIRADKLRPLAVTSAKRWFQLPDAPTVAESGFPAMTTSAWFGLVAQAKTAPEVVTRMNRELTAILKIPDFVTKLREVSFEALPGTPQDMVAASLRERAQWKKLIETSGATAD